MSEPTCHNCKVFGTPKCPDCTGYKHDYDTLCLEHPRIREYLMNDVIQELERRHGNFCDASTNTMDLREKVKFEGVALGIQKAISLLKGVKE